MDEVSSQGLNRPMRVAVSAMFFMNGAILGGMAPYFPMVKDTLHLSAREFGLSLLFPSFGAVLALPWLGKLIHRFGTRAICLVTGIVLCILVPLVPVAPSLTLFRIALFCVGVFNGNLDASMNAQSIMVQNLFHKPIISAVHGCWSIGGFIGAAGVAAASKFGVPPVLHLAIASGILLATIVVAVRWLIPSHEEDKGEEPVFAIPRGLLILIGCLLTLAFGVEGVPYDWAAVYLREAAGTSQSVAAIGFAAFSISMAAGRFLGDAFTHRFGNLSMLRTGSVVTCLGLLLAVCTPSAGLAILGFLVMGLGISNLIPILFRAAGSVPGVPAGIGIASVSLLGYFAFLVAPPAIGFLADKTTLAFALACAAGAVLPVGLLARRAIEPTGI